MADFLTRLAERTLNKVPVAQPMIASVFAPEPILPGFLPRAEAWSPLEQTQEVTTVFPAVPQIDVQSAINERQEVPIPFTPIIPKPSPIIAEQKEQVGTTPTVISQDNDELSAIPSQRLIADQPSALTGQLSLYPAPAAPGFPVEENETGIAAKHEATDPMRMKMEHTEIVSPVADIASPIEAQAGIFPREASIISGDEDMVLPTEVSNGEEDTYTMARQRISPGEERPGIAHVEEGFHRQAESPHAPVHFHDDSYSRGPAATPQGDHKGPLPTSTSSPAPTMTTRSPGDTSVTIAGRGPLWSPVDQTGRVEDQLSTANVSKGISPTMLRQDMPAVGGSADRPLVTETYSVDDKGISANGEELDQASRGVGLPHPRGSFEIVREGTGAGQAWQPDAPTGVPMPDNVELYVSRNVVVPLGDARPGEQGNGGGQPPSRGVDLPRPQLLVPHVQAQQEIIASQETELTSVEGNNSDPTLTRSQRYSPIEQERNNRFLAEQYSVLPAAETTQAAPTIRVTIGRIDVRAIPGPAPAPSSKPAKRSPALSLNDYLKQGKGGGRQ